MSKFVDHHGYVDPHDVENPVRPHASIGRPDNPAPLPLDPPTAPFILDDPVLSVQCLSGKFRFTASRANRPGVTTELLLQKLLNPRRRPSGAP